MAQMNLWLEKFRRDIGIKSSVIVFGNTTDILCSPSKAGQYVPVMDVLVSELRKKGFDYIVKWDKAGGIDHDISSEFVEMEEEEAADTQSDGGEDYDFGDLGMPGAPPQGKEYRDPGDFFHYMLNMFSSHNRKCAFLLDYSDYLFGNPNSLSEAERQYLSILGKTLERGKSYNMLSPRFDEIDNIVIIVAKNEAMIPPSYYLNNPMVSSVHVPLPGRNERKQFIMTNRDCLRVWPDISRNNLLMDDFIDALEGVTLKDIVQIMILSRQAEEPMSAEELINLYKYGEKVSPWEELSKEKIAVIEEKLGERVKGQDEAIEKVRDVIIRAYTGFSGLQHSSKQKKPKGTLFFVGPTGVGKTELAKALAEFVFGDENACIRFDMSEYNHEHSDQRLVGAPPGYVGYEAGGQLTNAVKEKPFCVLLFDEIEKANGKILDKFLQILEDGRLTDGKGETVSFSETIIIFTSNIGAADVNAEMGPYEAKKKFIEEVQTHFIEVLKRPELLNRIGDNIVAFRFIKEPAVYTQIAKSKFKTIRDFMKERYKADIEFTDEDQAFLAIGNAAGIQNGGRGLLNVMEAKLVNPLSEFVFSQSERLEGRTVVVSQLGKHAKFDFEVK